MSGLDRAGREIIRGMAIAHHESGGRQFPHLEDFTKKINSLCVSKNNYDPEANYQLLRELSALGLPKVAEELRKKINNDW
jgi:hypothetical protein